MKTLSVSLFRRPLCAALTLSAIARCDGIEDYHVLLNVDAQADTPHGDAVLRAARPFLRNPQWSLRSYITRGCNVSIVSCMEWGFECGSGFHVHIEDDTLPHIDFLRFMEWSNRRFFSDKDVFTACGYHNKDGDSQEARTRGWFTPWGWGTWLDRWEEARSQINVADTLSWDHQMNRIRGSRLEAFPVLGRILNIGQHDGAYNNPTIWSNEQFNPVWAGSYDPRRCIRCWSHSGEEEVE
jgi:hypothetical protein